MAVQLVEGSIQRCNNTREHSTLLELYTSGVFKPQGIHSNSHSRAAKAKVPNVYYAPTRENRSAGASPTAFCTLRSLAISLVTPR
jgi:hypothetical protein